MQDRGSTTSASNSPVWEKEPCIPLTAGEQDQVLRVCHPEIKDKLDYDQILPYLNSHLLLNRSDEDELDTMSRGQKINWLVRSLPRKGSDAMRKLMYSLKCTVDGTAHGELLSSLQQQVEKIKERRKTVSRSRRRGAFIAVIVGLCVYLSGYMDTIALCLCVSFGLMCCGGLVCILECPSVFLQVLLYLFTDIRLR